MSNLVEVQAPSARTEFPTQQQTSGRSGSSDVTSSTSKLRDSCHSCAVSKIKCPKEKPTCSRCEGRGIACQYFYTKRPGRKRESGSQSNSRRKSTSASSIKSNLNSNAKTTDSGRPKHGDSIQAVPGPSDKASSSYFLPRSPTPPRGSSRVANYTTIPPNLSISTSPRPENMFAPDSSDIMSVFGESNMFPGLDNFGTEIEDLDMDFAMSAMDSPFGLELSVLDGSGLAHTRSDTASLAIPREATNIFLADSDPSSEVVFVSASSEPSSLASNFQAPFPGTLSSRTNETPPSSCDCLLQALDLFKMLSSSPASPGVGFSPGGVDVTAKSAAAGDAPASDDSTARAVLAENKQSIEAINSMLSSCPCCAEDGFFLTVSSMAVLKIIRRYTTAARAQPAHTIRSRATSDAGSESAMAPRDDLQLRTISSSKDHSAHAYHVQFGKQGRGRTEAQLVLSELHRVQRLVNQLSPKLKGVNEKPGQNSGSVFNFGSHPMSGDIEKQMAAALSAGTLKQVENDLRRSLRTLSEEIITMLRKL